MLIVGRRVGESIVITGNIRILVVGLGQRKCRLAIDAPPEVTILRGELETRIRQPIDPRALDRYAGGARGGL